MNEDVRILFEKQCLMYMKLLSGSHTLIKFYDTLVVRLFEAMDVELQYTLIRVIPRS